MKKTLMLILFSSAIILNAQYWSTVGSAGFSPGQANYTSLAINETTPYVAFSDLANSGKATLMKYDGQNWVYVGSPGFSEGTAEYISLIFNGSTPYVAYQDFGNSGKATVMKYDGQNWVYVGLPGFSEGGAYYTNLAFNEATPYLAYMDEFNSSKVSVMKYDGTNWVYVGSPGFSAGRAYYIPLVFNGTTPYLAYRDLANGNKATVMKFDGQNWVSVGSPGFTINEADYISLAFNGTTPYISFEDYGYSTRASVMKFDGTNWEYVGSSGFTGGWTCFTNLAFYGTTPYIAYWDGANSFKASVMKYDGNNWVYVGTPGFSAGKTYYNTFAFMGSSLYVAYQDYAHSYKATVMKFDESPTETYEVNLSSDPINGGALSGANTYYAGTQVTLSVIESAGFSFAYWSENGNIVSYNKNYSFIINSNRNLVAHFNPIQFSVSVSINPPNSGSITGDGLYNNGSTVNLKATPNAGCKFLNWSENGDVVSSDSNYSFPIYSNKSFTAHFLIMPGTPKANNANSITQTSFVANWNVVSSVDGYYLDVALDNQFNNILSRYNNLDVGNVNSNSVGSLIENVKYYFRVRSYNAAGISGFSNIITVTTLPNEPSTPIATEASSTSATGFTANWNAVDEADGYYIDVAIDPNFENKVNRFDNLDVGNVTKYDVTGLTENLVYYYRVRAYNSGGASENSNIVSILVTKVEDTSYPTNYKLFQNFPNPFNPTTTIEYTLKNDSQVLISVYNILGQEVKTLVNDYKRAGYHRLEFDGTNLESGIYVYRIVACNFSDVKRMMLLK